MKRLWIVLTGVVFFMSSCEKEIGSETNTLSPNETVMSDRNARTSSDINKIYDSKSNLKREFGKALIMAMKESPQLRELIKKRL
jgi:hypothetical protein